MVEKATSTSRSTANVSVLLTGYKRPQHLSDQITAVRNQTVPIREIWLYQNTHPAVLGTPAAADGLDRVITCRPNIGVWPRFAMCYEFETEYVCVFDDDTIPGPKWLESCLANMATAQGLYGTIGIRFPASGRRPYQRFGWAQPNEARVQVDIVGHAWFFKREWIRSYIAESRPMQADGTHYRTCGEDYWFSYVLQRRVGLPTFVPPHPASDTSVWGSLFGSIGRDGNALNKYKGEEEKKAAFHATLRASGWRLCCDG